MAGAAGTGEHQVSLKRAPFFAGFRALDPATRRLLAVGFLFTLARFSEGFLILKGIDIGLSEALSPLTLALFNLAYVALAYPAGALSDRISPRIILFAGMGALIAGNLVLAKTDSFAGLVVGVGLWGAHMALTQGIFSRMIADSAPEPLRATSFGAFWFVTGIAVVAGKPRRGNAVGPRRAKRDLLHQRRGRRRRAGDARAARGRTAR